MKPSEIIREDESMGIKMYPVVRYYELRCKHCKRMLYCHNWESYGYPHTYCDACGIKHYWPFDGRKDLAKAYNELGE